MYEHTMELRGIPLSQLVDYLNECAGRLAVADNWTDEAVQLPLRIQTGEWQAEILREEIVTITSRFHVNAVFIRFAAKEEEALSRLLARFRTKVIRVGG